MKQRPSPDTEKQRRVEWHLSKGGYPHGWRQWLRDQRKRGLSTPNLAFAIRQYTGIAIDPSTVGEWLKQALAEDRGEGSGVGGQAPESTKPAPDS